MFLQLFNAIYDVLGRKIFFKRCSGAGLRVRSYNGNKLPYCIVRYIVFSHFRETPVFNMLFLFSVFFFLTYKVNYIINFIIQKENGLYLS